MKSKHIINFILFISILTISQVCHAQGVEELLVDFGDYISTKLIPAAGMAGVGIGGIMASLGSPAGIEVVKYSIIGGIVGTAGAQTLSALFF